MSWNTTNTLWLNTRMRREMNSTIRKLIVNTWKALVSNAIRRQKLTSRMDCVWNVLIRVWPICSPSRKISWYQGSAFSATGRREGYQSRCRSARLVSKKFSMLQAEKLATWKAVDKKDQKGVDTKGPVLDMNVLVAGWRKLLQKYMKRIFAMTAILVKTLNSHLEQANREWAGRRRIAMLRVVIWLDFRTS